MSGTWNFSKNAPGIYEDHSNKSIPEPEEKSVFDFPIVFELNGKTYKRYEYNYRLTDPEVIREFINLLVKGKFDIGGGKEDRVRRFKQALSHIDITTSEELMMIIAKEIQYDREYIFIDKVNPHFKKGTKNTIIDYIDFTYFCTDKFSDNVKLELVPRWVGVEDADPSLFKDDAIDVKSFCGFDLRVYFDEGEYE